MKCPKCGSENLVAINLNFPYYYKCSDCSYEFQINKNPFIDE
ncbi:MAG: hypothetical protein QXW01_03000 [Candidatus Aenigmatarchaeota archaeon]